MTDKYTFVIVQDGWRWALRDPDGNYVLFSDHAFEDVGDAAADLEGSQARVLHPEAGVEKRERC